MNLPDTYSRGGGWSDQRARFIRPACHGRFFIQESEPKPKGDELTGFRPTLLHRQPKEPTTP